MRQIIAVALGMVLFACNNSQRTQEPNEPLPYLSSEIVFNSASDNIRLAGVLTTPSGDSARTAVVLIGGSGKSDRDYTNGFGHKPFLVLSHHLTRQGLAVLRYDERGVGQSEGNYEQASYEALVSDVVGAVQFLRSKGFVKIGLIGHSEGGAIAPVASLRSRIDFLVLMAPDNDTADKELTAQTTTRLRQMGAPEGVKDEVLRTLDTLVAIVKRERDPAIARAHMQKAVTDRMQYGSSGYQEMAKRLGDSNKLIDDFLETKFIYRLQHHPLETFKKVRVPVLVMYGDSDNLLDVSATLPKIDSALDSTVHEIKIFPGVGHLFMNSKNVPLENLRDLEETISPDVLTFMSAWISKQ